MKRDVIKTVQNNVETVIDKETGEVLDINVKKLKIVINPEDFALIYAGFWNVLLENKLSKSDIQLLAYLTQRYSDGTPFTINSFIKNQLSNVTGKSSTTYDRCTKVLLDNKLIYRVSKRLYRLNPRYAFKGSTHNRNKAVIEMIDFCVDC